MKSRLWRDFFLACPCGPGFPLQVLAHSSLWAFHFTRGRRPNGPEVIPHAGNSFDLL
jgi:hypothetical protein